MALANGGAGLEENMIEILTDALDTEWICLDCTAECEDRAHAWVRARRVEREDAEGRASDAWVVDLTDLNENPDV